MSKPNELLEELYSSSLKRKTKSFTSSKDLKTKIEFICRCNANKAPIRFLMSCLLAKLDKPNVDIRKPYTEIPGNDAFLEGIMMKRTFKLLFTNTSCLVIQLQRI